MERDQYWKDRDWCLWLEFVFACVIEELPTGFSVTLWHPWFCWFGSVRNEILQSLNPKDRERESHPCVCVKLKSVSCTSNLLVRTCDFRKYTKFHLMSISSLQDLLQNQSFETILVCIVVLCFPHNSIAGIHMCDECKGWNVPNVCHMLLSISLPHGQVWSQTIKYQVYQYVPSIDMSEQFVRKLWKILQLIHFLLLWTDGHPCMALRVCIIAQLFYSQIRNIFPRISLHDLPCHKTMKISFRHQGSPWLLFLTIFCSTSRNPWFEHTFVINHNILAYLTFSLSATQINMVEGCCWFSQINVFHENFPCRTNVLIFSSQVDVVHKHW